MDSLHNFISQSINTNTLLPNQHINTLSNQLYSTICHVIANATALVAACPPVTVPSKNLREEIAKQKSFAVLSDLKSHAKQCRGESTWKCSCGTTFSRKERLFGHVAVFEGHLPAADGEGAMLTKESDGLDELPKDFFDDLENYYNIS